MPDFTSRVTRAGGHGDAGHADQADLGAVPDLQPLGVVGVDVHEAVGVVEEEDLILALQRLAVLDQDVLMPVVERVAES